MKANNEVLENIDYKNSTQEISTLETSPYTYTFWTEYILNPSRSDYNIVLSQTVDKNLDLKRLSDALIMLIKDNPLMNCYLGQKKQNLFWFAHSKISSLKVIPASQFNSELIYSPFKLDEDWLYRFYLVENKSEFRIVMIFHHAIIDGNAYNELIEKISNYYNNSSQSYSFSIDAYTEICKKQKQTIQYLENSGTKDFWKKKLSSMPQKNDVPISQTKNKNMTIGWTDFSLLNSDWIQWRQGLSPDFSDYNIMMAVWGVIIARICGNKKSLISYPIKIKKSGGLSYGAQVNLAFMPIDIDDNQTFEGLMSKIYQLITEAKSDHQNYYSLPTSKMTEDSGVFQFDVAFSRLHIYPNRFNLNNCKTISSETLSIDISGSELWLQYDDYIDKKIFRLVYREDLFSKAHIDYIKKAFVNFLEVLCCKRTAILNFIPLMSPNNYRSFSIDNSDYKLSKNKTIIDIFENQVMKHPKNLAIKFRDFSIDYQTLNMRANNVASLLMRNFEQINKKTHLIIGILIEKSINIIPVIFGILKAGAAFLPIHSDTPDYRIKEIVKNSKIRILLIDQKSCNNKAKLFSEITNNGCEIINLDQYKLKDQFSESNLNYSKPDKLAYVIYTSGSTGIPKGVMIQHKSLMFFIEHQLNKFKINENEKIALIHSFSFDASIEQYCIALLSGACVVLYELTDYESPNDFLTALNNDEISHLDMTPSFLKAYDINRVPSIKRIITGGEACSKNLLEKYSQKRLINEYGPTEVTIVALQHFYRSGDPHHLIGRPISHLGAYIIDQHRNLQPKNTVGELAFSGPAVALGYLNDPKLTQEKFIDNQFKETFSLSNDHDTLYLTGDLAIMDDDGAIKFIGRKDNQVKIRGYRVELSEIEYHLCAHPEIIDSKVLVTSNDQISAYIVTKHCEICLDSLKNFLYERLPLYMIPNLFYRLDFIPTSENFKIDEKNITAHVIRLTHTGYEKPKSNLEQTIHSIWSKILAVEELGINDDFFALGGNSINCIDLMSKLENQGISLNIKEIYTNRTIKRMASYIESLKPNDSVPKPDFKNVSKLSKIFHLRLFKDLLRYINANEIESFISHYSPFIHATGKKSPSAATITYLLPPGNGGAESYLHDILINLNGEYFAFNNIVNALSNYFSDYIFQILTIENIADYYLYYIKNTSRNKYYQLFGWCFGGLISFEIARQAARLKKTNLTQLLMVDTYFDFKTASKIDHEKLLPNQDYCLLNYKYNPEFISNLKNIKVTLAKSVIADNQEDLSKQLVFKEKECGIHWFSGVNKYYAELTTTNHLDKLLRKENFETILIQRSHTKWSSDNQTVRYISMLLNSPESSTTHKRLNITSSKYIEA